METEDSPSLAAGVETGMGDSKMQQKQSNQLLTLLHHAQRLQMNGINSNENAVNQHSIQARSKPGAISIQPPAIASNEIAQVTACNLDPYNKIPNGGQVHAPSQLDKALPPMPEIPTVESFNQRGDSYAADTPCNGIDLVIPPSDPKAVGVHLHPAETPLSDCGSFTPTSSIRTLADGTNIFVEIGIAKNVSLRPTCGQSRSRILPAPQNSTIISPGRIAFNHVATQKHGSSKQRRRLKSGDVGKEHIRFMEQRHSEDDTVTIIVQEPLQGAESNILKSQAVPVEGCGILGSNKTLSKSGAANKSTESSSHGSKDTPRRISHKYGMGPTIRFSTDAHEVIMGPQSSSTTDIASEESQSVQEIRQSRIRQQSLPTIQTSHRGFAYTLQTSLYSRPSSSHTKDSRSNSSNFTYPAGFDKSGPRFTIRSSSLPNPSVSLKSSGHKVLPIPVDSLTARLSRPTKASRARAAESRSTLFERGQRGGAVHSPDVNRRSAMASCYNSSKQTSMNSPAVEIDQASKYSSNRVEDRDFRSRLFSIIPNFRRLNFDRVTTASASKLRSSQEIHARYQNADHSEKEVFRGTTSWNLGPTKDRNDRSLPTAFSTQGDGNASQVESAPNAPQQRKKSQQVLHTNEPPESFLQKKLRSHVVDRTPSAGEASHPNNHEEPLTPPPSRELPRTQLIPEKPRTQALPMDQTNYDENGVSHYLDQLLDHAENQFHQVVDAGNASTNPQARTAIREILEPLAAAIAATRAARISAIALTNANAELAKYAATLSSQACRAALDTTTTTTSPSVETPVSERELPHSEQESSPSKKSLERRQSIEPMIAV